MKSSLALDSARADEHDKPQTENSPKFSEISYLGDPDGVMDSW